MVRRAAAFALAVFLLLGLTGCSVFSVQNVNDLLRAPALSPGQDEIRKALNSYLGGLEPQYKFPKGGDWLSPMLQADLNGDGKDEAMLLYSVADDVNAASERGTNVNVAVLERADGTWTVTGDIVGRNTEVASIEVADLLDDGTRQLLVGYASAKLTSRVLSVYTYTGAGLTEAFSFEYSRYEIGDFSGQGASELVVVSSTTTPGDLQLYYIHAKGGELVGGAAEAVSLGANSVSCVNIAPSASAAGEHLMVVDVMVTGEQLASQLLIFSEDHFYPWEGFDTTVSNTIISQTSRENSLLISRDIDGDGIVEIPLRGSDVNIITTLRGDKNMEYVDWWDFTAVESTPVIKQFGVADYDRAAYIRLPEAWRESIQVVDGAGAGEWNIINRQTMATLVSLHVARAGDNVPPDARPVPGNPDTYLQYHGGLSAADREIITVTALS
ncbi:hypothetical protein LJC60_09395 [Ruminococcaceae bacterium OttesenSCG-928-D13]|nr:hypothetical protein [Ruminococcaceae bacterium OttesenSCG-928-D13]